MIRGVSSTRQLSANLMDEWCRAAARDASPSGSTEAEIAVRAFLIFAFIYGDLRFPSRALH